MMMNIFWTQINVPQHWRITLRNSYLHNNPTVCPNLFRQTTRRSKIAKKNCSPWRHALAKINHFLYFFFEFSKGCPKAYTMVRFFKLARCGKEYKDRNVNFGEMTRKIIDACLCRKLGSGASKRIYTIAHSIKNGKSKCPSCRGTRWK
jgi:hypothetical protein